jgi:hypothetical protein
MIVPNEEQPTTRKERITQAVLIAMVFFAVCFPLIYTMVNIGTNTAAVVSPYSQPYYLNLLVPLVVGGLIIAVVMAVLCYYNTPDDTETSSRKA